MNTKNMIIIGVFATILICGALLTYGLILNNTTHEVIVIEKNNTTNNSVDVDSITKEDTNNNPNADNNKNTKNTDNQNSNDNNNQPTQQQSSNDGVYHSPQQYRRIGEDVRNGREVAEVQSGWPNAGHWVYTDTGEEIYDY
jgi:hypothetical protein